MIDATGSPGDLHLQPAAAVAPDAIEHLLDAAFGPDRHERTAYRLRAGTRPIGRLSVAACESAGRLVGVGLCWPLRLTSGAEEHALILVGPVAVHPDRQGHGIGTLLMRHIVAAADSEETAPLLLIGDPGYYGRFGFDAAPTGSWQLPGPVERHRLLVRPSEAALPRDGMLGPWADASLRRAG